MASMSFWDRLPTEIQSLIFSFDATYVAPMMDSLYQISLVTSRRVAHQYLDWDNEKIGSLQVFPCFFRYHYLGSRHIVTFVEEEDFWYKLTDFNVRKGTFRNVYVKLW